MARLNLDVMKGHAQYFRLQWVKTYGTEYPLSQLERRYSLSRADAERFLKALKDEIPLEERR